MEIALVLLIVGVILLAVELTGLGAGVAGPLAALALIGSLALASDSNNELAPAVAITSAVAICLGVAGAIWASWRALREPVRSGPESLVGRVGEVRGDQVFCDGALWQIAPESGELSQGARVRVEGVSGELALRVRPDVTTPRL